LYLDRFKEEMETYACGKVPDEEWLLLLPKGGKGVARGSTGGQSRCGDACHRRKHIDDNVWNQSAEKECNAKQRRDCVRNMRDRKMFMVDRTVD
jgi:hypothetical protein